ncbi:Serine/threonine-protein kinase HT1, partial [Leucoagaricus sp. SymC.cos]
LLREANLADNIRRRTLDLLRKTIQSARVIPKRLELSGVECDFDYSKVDTTGGFGDVFPGTYGNRTACIKVVRSTRSQTLDDLIKKNAVELAVSAHIIHENILPFYGVWIFGQKKLAGVSEWMENGNLHSYLKFCPDTPRLPLIADIIAGLDYLHGVNIIHADLKAVNVLISSERRALLADFGISRVVATVASKSGTLGTIFWTAPEIFIHDLAKNPDSPRTMASDIWSFACTCYEV